MTGYQSKKKAALDEEGMYLVHQTNHSEDNLHMFGQPVRKPVEDVVEYFADGTRTVRIAAKRPWVDLTDEEMQAVVDAQLLVSNINVYFKAIQAKLKEKNNG